MMQVEDADKIQALVSNDAQDCYNRTKEDDAYPSLEELMQVEDVKKIQALTSYAVQKCYKSDNGPDFNDLKDLSVDKIKDLTKEGAYKIYRSGKNWKEYAKENEIDLSPFEIKEENNEELLANRVRSNSFPSKDLKEISSILEKHTVSVASASSESKPQALEEVRKKLQEAVAKGVEPAKGAKEKNEKHVQKLKRRNSNSDPSRGC